MRHPCYISTFFLARSTDLVINVMKEVKVREDEYSLIKSLLFKYRGYRWINWLCGNEGFCTQRSYTSLRRMNTSRETEPSPKPTNRASRLVNAIHEWVPKRSNSVKSTASSSTGTSAF